MKSEQEGAAAQPAGATTTTTSSSSSSSSDYVQRTHTDVPKVPVIPPTTPLYGIDGTLGTIMDMRPSEIWEPYVVKVQTFKSAVDSACMLLRIDDIVSGQKKKQQQEGAYDPDAMDKMDG